MSVWRSLWAPFNSKGSKIIVGSTDWNFTHDALQEMGAQFHKVMFRNKSMWVKRMTFLKDLFFVSPNKYLLIWLTILGNTVI